MCKHSRGESRGAPLKGPKQLSGGEEFTAPFPFYRKDVRKPEQQAGTNLGYTLFSLRRNWSRTKSASPHQNGIRARAGAMTRSRTVAGGRCPCTKSRCQWGRKQSRRGGFSCRTRILRRPRRAHVGIQVRAAPGDESRPAGIGRAGRPGPGPGPGCPAAKGRGHRDGARGASTAVSRGGGEKLGETGGKTGGDGTRP
jgi:hypothetical protein